MSIFFKVWILFWKKLLWVWEIIVGIFIFKKNIILLLFNKIYYFIKIEDNYKN